MKNKNTTTTNKSLIKKLREQNKISDEILVCINSLSLENLIAIKLELCATHINNRLYGLDIWRKTSYIVKDALLKFAISTTNSKKDAARFLGLTSQDFYKACKQFEINQHFQ